MNRLDALKARVAVATADESRWTDYDVFVTRAREDIERLVVVVEAAQALLKVPLGENSLYDFKEDRLVDALAYWQEESE